MIQHLNVILGNELIAINQYFLHAKILKSWGITKLADITRAESIDEMKHADMLADRILDLHGLPNFQDLGRLSIGESVQEMLSCDLKTEVKALKDLRAAIQHAESVADFATRDLLAGILESEEGHMHFLEVQLSLIDRLGEQNYLQSQVL